MTSAAVSSNQRRRYIWLGLRVTLAPNIDWRFPLIEATRADNANGAEGPEPGAPRHRLARSPDFWMMVIIPVDDAAKFAEAVLQNVIEFWNGEVIEIGAGDQPGDHHNAPRPAVHGNGAVMTVVHDRTLVTEQHVVKVVENGFETNGGIRFALCPVSDGHEALVTISHENGLVSEQRVVKVKANSFEVRDASGQVTGTLQMTTAGGIPLTDTQGRFIRRLTPKDLMDVFWKSRLGSHSIPSSVSYGLTPANGEIAWGEIHSRRQLERTQS